jgi:hypothetical protein
VMPQMPANAAACINGRYPYWVYASEPHVAAGVKRDRRNSAATQRHRENERPPGPPPLEATSRSRANGSVTVAETKSDDLRKYGVRHGKNAAISDRQRGIYHEPQGQNPGHRRHRPRRVNEAQQCQPRGGWNRDPRDGGEQ